MSLDQGCSLSRGHGVLVWKLDRFVRWPAEFERFWSVWHMTRTKIRAAMDQSGGTPRR